MAMVTVCDVAIARRLPFGETESCCIGSPIWTLRTYKAYINLVLCLQQRCSILYSFHPQDHRTRFWTVSPPK